MTSHFQNLGRKGPECRAHVGPPTGERRGLAAERALESSLTPFVWLKSRFSRSRNGKRRQSIPHRAKRKLDVGSGRCPWRCVAWGKSLNLSEARCCW